MGFDVTFHPIGGAELQRFLFDVIADGSLAEHRAAELAKTPKERDTVLKLYRAFPNWIAEKAPVGSSFAFAAAIVAGFLHPYWYARGTALTFLAEGCVPELADVFVPLGRVAPGVLADAPDRHRGMIWGNDSASGLIPADRITSVRHLLESLADRPGRGSLSLLETIVDEDALESLRAALQYCAAHNLGMIEASDVVVPFSGQCLTRYTNLRATFLDKMDP
ncbi:MAG TPA: hypothetical protein VGI81_09445 [Tepidisphaeraceae bacterium]|jgi:hypothetical protein